MPDIFFLVEERSDGASEAWAGVPASASLRAGAGALSKADRTNIFIDTDKHIDTHEKRKKIGHIQSGKVRRCRHVGHTQKVCQSCYVGHMN